MPHRIYMQKSCMFCAQEALTHCENTIIFNDIRDLKKFTFFYSRYVLKESGSVRGIKLLIRDTDSLAVYGEGQGVLHKTQTKRIK